MANRVNAGQTVPFKFQFRSGQNFISDMEALVYIRSTNLVDCLRDRPDPPVDERGSSTIHYDEVEHQFIINWKTKKGWANTCRKFIVTLNDGSDHIAYLEFVK